MNSKNMAQNEIYTLKQIITKNNINKESTIDIIIELERQISNVESKIHQLENMLDDTKQAKECYTILLNELNEKIKK